MNKIENWLAATGHDSASDNFLLVSFRFGKCDLIFLK